MNNRPKIGQECKYKNMTGIVYAIYPGMNGVSVVCQVHGRTKVKPDVLDKVGVHFTALWTACVGLHPGEREHDGIC